MNAPVVGSIEAPEGALVSEYVTLLSGSVARAVKDRVSNSLTDLLPMEDNKGESLIGVMVMDMVAVLLSKEPSLTLKVNESEPL